jgi:hypothetical protein
MKNFVLVISLLIISSLKIFPQWSTDPNNNLIIGYGWDPHIVSDSAGGGYVTYNYESFYPQKLAVERLDKYGYKPWGNKKQILGELPEQWHAEIIEDGEGGVIVSYEDNEVIGTDYTTRVRVQKVDSNGNFLWGQTGVRVNLNESNHGAQELVSDGEGGCVIVWQNLDASYWMNRINRFGQREWGDTGIAIGNGNSKWIIRASDGNYYVQTGLTVHRIGSEGHLLNQYSVTLGYPVPDPEGGIVLSGRVWNGMIPKLVAQRKDSLGNNLWQDPYVEIADSLFINSQLSIIYNSNYYFGWTSNINGIETQPYIQGLRDDGTELFINGGISLSNRSTTITSFIPIIPSGNISNIYIWTQWINQPSSTGNFAVRIDTTATQIWEDSAVVLNTPALRYLGVTTDCSGGVIGTGYLNEDFAIRIFKISANGKLGEVITSSENNIEDILTKQSFLYQNYPNPFNSTTTIKYLVHKYEWIRIVLYNILGEELKIISDGHKSIGSYTLTFNSNELPSGVYLYTLETASEVMVKKLTIIK